MILMSSGVDEAILCYLPNAMLAGLAGESLKEVATNIIAAPDMMGRRVD